MLTYLCHVDGLTIFYRAFATDNTDSLEQRYQFLTQFADSIDIAFLPLPETDQEMSDMRLFLKHFPVRTVLLLDSRRREYMFPETARQIANWGYSTEVLCAKNPGDHFSIRPSGK